MHHFQMYVGIVNLHPTKRSHWFIYIDENFFDPYGAPPPKKLSSFHQKTGYCFFSQNKIEGKQSNPTTHQKFLLERLLLVKNLQVKVLEIDFKSVFNFILPKNPSEPS